MRHKFYSKKDRESKEKQQDNNTEHRLMRREAPITILYFPEFSGNFSNRNLTLSTNLKSQFFQMFDSKFYRVFFQLFRKLNLFPGKYQ